MELLVIFSKDSYSSGSDKSWTDNDNRQAMKDDRETKHVRPFVQKRANAGARRAAESLRPEHLTVAWIVTNSSSHEASPHTGHHHAIALNTGISAIHMQITGTF